MRRYIIALLALLAVMAGSLVMIVSTSPQAGAATSRPANVGHYSALWHPRNDCDLGTCYGWAVSTSSVWYNASDPGNITEFDIGGNGNGYQEIIQWIPQTGYTGCMGWNNSLAEVVLQKCTGASWQLWAGTGGSPDLIWNQWYNNTFHNNCPVPGGYTQSVVSAFFGGYPAGDLGLYCPQNSATQYAPDQYWDIINGGG